MNWDRVLYPLDLVGCNLFGRLFVGAFDIAEILNVGRDLKNQGFNVTYNLLGEHVHDPNLTDAALQTTLGLIGQMNEENLGNVSCKPTLYGLSISKHLFLKNVGRIIDLAGAKEIEIEFDAENYVHIEDTFNIFSHFASQLCYRKTVRQAVQAHLNDINLLMDKYELWDKKLRIVKGAGVYTEADSSVVVNNEEKIMEKYFEIIKRNMLFGRNPFVATVRDRELAESVIGLVGDNECPFEFEMLYGPLGRNLGKELLRRGYPVRIYIPFVVDWCRNEWKAYGLRRAKMIRNLVLKNLKII